MWIVPKNLHTSAFAVDTEALTSDSKELSEMFAQSLIAKSGTSPARTWSARLKRGGWITRLSGRILKPSRGQSFVGKWTSSLEASLVSHLVPQEEKQETRTSDTCGPTLSEASESWSDLPLFSLKMLKEYSPPTSRETIGQTHRELPFCSMSLESWSGWVIAQRQEYSQRLKSERPTNGSASLFLVSEQTSQMQGAQELENYWRTPTLGEVNRMRYKDVEKALKIEQGGSQKSLWLQVIEQPWPTPKASESHETVEQHLARAQKPSAKNRGPSLTVAVQMDKLWPTPTTQENAHPQMTLTPTGRRAGAKEGSTCHSMNLCDAAILAEYAEKIADPLLCIGANSGPQVEESLSSLGNPHESLQETADPQTQEVMKEEKRVLNPRWVEVLMGLPVGWTMPSCAVPLTLVQTSCAFLETELSLPPQSEPSESCGVAWTTPIVRDYMEASMHGPHPDRKDGKTRDDTMPRQVHHETGYTGFVNPRWVEVLMGLPVGWTLPSCSVITMPLRLEAVTGDSHALMWKTPSTMEAEGGIKQVRKDDTAQLKLRDQVAHQGSLDYWPEPIDAPPYLPKKNTADKSGEDSEALMWKTPRACEADGGVKQVREGGSTNYKLRDQVAHQGDLDYWPAPKPQKG